MNGKTSLQLYKNRIFSPVLEINRWLSFSVFFSCLLVLARIIYTGRITFLSLVWNLFLAYIPYFITKIISTRPGWIKEKKWFILFFLLWLICIPNSFYILTDLFHLGDQRNDYIAPQWYDLALILSFAWNGLMIGILSVRHMEKIIGKIFPGLNEFLFLYPVMWLNALGIYIGRYLRFNSWDVVSDPFQLFDDIAHLLMHPFIYKETWAMVFCYSILMTLMYLTIKKISKAI